MQLDTLWTLLFFLFTSAVWGHPTSSDDEDSLIKDMSFNDLLQTRSLQNTNFQLGDDSVLNEGRIILTPKTDTKGSLWLNKLFTLKDSFTLEITLRSVNYLGRSDGGLSIFFIEDDNKKTFVNDQLFYNGPSQFDGLNLLIDNDGPISPTIRGTLNDNSLKLNKKNIYDKNFASCIFPYQDSSVPSTLRLSYNDFDKLLKLQVDNKVCFQTRKISLTKGANFRIGVTGKNSEKSNENFEILKFKLFDQITENALLPNSNEMSQPKLLTKVIDKTSGKEKLIEKDLYDQDNQELSNYKLFKKLDHIEGKILANDISTLQKQIDQILITQEKLANLIQSLEKNFMNVKNSDNNDKNDNSNYKDFISLNSKLEQMLSEQQRLRENSLHEKELVADHGPQLEKIFNRLIMWFSPLVLVIMVMAYYTFKIRQEIVKTKLL